MRFAASDLGLHRGWSGGAKVLCILHHRGVQLILAYSWARPAILVVGKGRGGMFLFLLFLHFHSCSSFFPVPLFHLLYSLFYLFSPFLWETTQNDPQGLTCRKTPTQSKIWVYTVCSGLSVRIRRVSTEIRPNRIPSEIILDPPLIQKKKKNAGLTRKIHHQGVCS